MKGKFQYDWIIRIITKNDRGIQIEIADLGNNKHMIVATDLQESISDGVFRQAGYGPFTFDSGETLDDCANVISTLKDSLINKRAKPA